MPEKPDDNVIIAYEPDTSLQKIIGEGVHFKDILTPELRQACQKLIDDARDAFFEEEKEHVDEMRALIKRSNPADLPKITTLAAEIRAQARIFGFSFISNLCEQITNFSAMPGKNSETVFLVISRFADALHIAVAQRMRDEGGLLEQELKLSIEHLKH